MSERSWRGGKTRPGDVFFSRWGSGGPAAVDLTVRDPLAPSHPVRQVSGLEPWRLRQEEGKGRKYLAQCQRWHWQFVPFVMDVFGGFGGQARRVVSHLVTCTLGELEAWKRREMEASIWQELSLALAREVGRQLAWGLVVEPDSERWVEAAGWVGVHAPFLD